jgi:hypothetical protein
MPYASTFGKKVYPYQSEELSPEEQAGVPMLTNIPQSAETAAGRGQDVYFLSDRPETEQFLAERTPERPYKRVLRDVRASKPFVDEDQLMDAVEKGKKFLGFNPMEPPNPGQVAQEAYQKYFDRVPREQYENWPDNIKQMHVKAAQAEEKKAYDRAVKDIGNAHQYLTSHASEWEKQKKEIRAAQEPSKEPLVPVMEGNKVVYRRRSQALGAEAPVSQLVQVEDAEGNITYQPRTQAVGATPPTKPEKLGKKVSYVGWDKTGKETVERVDIDDTDSQSDLIGKGYVEKSKFDRMDMVDRKLAQREAMKRIGGGIPLDRVTAAKFLKEAGGDKEKARKLAREKGYTF